MPKINIPMPYLCQYDNLLSPGGTCNMTSLGMVLDKYGLKVPGPHSRTPDNLTAYCNANNLDRHALEVITKLAEKYGLLDNSSYHDNFEQIKAHLLKGLPVIVQGAFTPSGHVMPIRGFDSDKDEWIVNDPAGFYPHYENPGWIGGEDVSYPSVWFRKAAAPDGQIWAHLLSKK